MLFTEGDQKRLDFLKLCIRKYNHTDAKMLQYWNWICNNPLCISVPCHLSDAVFLLRFMWKNMFSKQNFSFLIRALKRMCGHHQPKKEKEKKKGRREVEGYYLK